MKKATTLYSNEFDSERFELAKEHLQEIAEINDEKQISFSDDDIWEQMYRDDNDEWECFEYDFKRYFDTHTLVCFAELGLWYGHRTGYKVINSWDEFVRVFGDLDEITIKDENGLLVIDGCHHDGRNHFEFRELTDKGEEYVNNWYIEPTVKALKTNFYSKYPRLAQSL